jgi:hypothetical protein
MTCVDPREQTDVKMGRNVRAELIVVFKSNVSPDDRARFNEETIGRKIPGRDGVSFRKGIEASLALPNVCLNRDGLALKLRDDITDDQLQDIKSAISNSFLVDTLFENIEPTNVQCSSSNN